MVGIRKRRSMKQWLDNSLRTEEVAALSNALMVNDTLTELNLGCGEKPNKKSKS